jgi:organic anion transporter 4A
MAASTTADDDITGVTNKVVQLQEDHLEVSPAPDHQQGRRHYFGCGPCHPKWLQVLFAKKKFFTFLLTSFTFLQSSVVSGIIPSIISTIEKRYNFNSTQSGLMIITYDISAILSVIFVSYFGSKTHQPRLLGASLLLFTFGTLLFSSPQFLFGNYNAGLSDNLYREECLADNNYNNDTTNCDGSTNTNVIAYVIFVASQVILGLGVTPLYTIGFSYLDEIVYPKYVPLHLGVVSIMIVAGPGVGYGFGSAFLSIYVDPWVRTSLTPLDPAWVGAWWIPLVLTAVAMIIVAIPFLMYPRYLPDSHLVKTERAKEMAKVYSSKYAEVNSTEIIFKLFPIQIKRLLLNFPFIFIILGLSATYIFIQGGISFTPKFLEVQYGFTAFTSGLIVAAIGIPFSALGTLTGALIVFGCKTTGQKNAIVIVICMIIVLPLALAYLIHCPGTPIAGLTAQYRDGSIDGSNCTSLCNCSSNAFDPVCGSDYLTYLSPCKAGCTPGINGTYENCSCISQSYITLPNNSTAVTGLCQQSCLMFIPGLMLLSMLIYLAFTIQLPFIHFVIRVVADDQRALALGMQSAVSRVLGSVPGPLILGALFDAACILWQEECGVRGNCWVYDNAQLSYNMISLGLPVYFIGLVLFSLAMLTYPKKKDKKLQSEELKEKAVEVVEKTEEVDQC